MWRGEERGPRLWWSLRYSGGARRALAQHHSSRRPDDNSRLAGEFRVFTCLAPKGANFYPLGSGVIGAR